MKWMKQGRNSSRLPVDYHVNLAVRLITVRNYTLQTEQQCVTVVIVTVSSQTHPDIFESGHNCNQMTKESHRDPREDQRLV